ncbi:MAG: hypothetical protein HYV92_14225 [Candidatus Rokubacteria bacterium]|nr:hypothetical protein [Candidatus Rokubacteria bacterium]MBI2555542.1 hypothetical protein [Candidatus Rokubacteria bacterium]
MLATYLGVLSLGGVQGALQWLEAKSGAGDTFQRPGAIRGEGFFVLLAFMLLAPLAVAVALFLVLFVLVVLAGTLAPVGRLLGLPNWVLMTLAVGGLGGLAYAEREVWVPWGLWMVGLFASAFLSVLP